MGSLGEYWNVSDTSNLAIAWRMFDLGVVMMLNVIALTTILLGINSGKEIISSQPGATIPFSGDVGPLIAEDAGTVAHVMWNGSALVDTKGNAWTQNGTVPQVAKSGKTPAGAGPFSDVNFYSLGTGNDVLDFAGDFSICIVLSHSAFDGRPLGDGLAASDGWFLHVAPTAATLFSSRAGAATAIVTANAPLVNTLNVICAGRAGASQMIKLNLGATASGLAASPITPAVTRAALVGRYASPGNAFTGTIYEVWASIAPASDALFTDVMNRVKSRAGVTAW